MAKKAKKKASSWHLPTPARKVVSFAWGPGRPWLVGLLMVAALVGAWYSLWKSVGDEVLASAEYQVTAESLDITPPPQWIRSDLRGEVFRDGRLDGLSIMDPDANKRVANAFSLHAWVARVVKVTKCHPSRVKIDLEYRRPVCMVQVRTDEGWGLLPVDVRGVRLPSGGFSSLEATRNYLQLVNVDTSPVGGEGTQWGDERVVGGAEIAAALLESWREWNLVRIVPTKRLVSGHRGEWTYELFTRGETRVLWGRAPRTKSRSEIPAQEKVARLREYVAQHGSLDDRRGRQEIDLRDKAGLRVIDRMANGDQADERALR